MGEGEEQPEGGRGWGKMKLLPTFSRKKLLPTMHFSGQFLNIRYVGGIATWEQKQGSPKELRSIERQEWPSEWDSTWWCERRCYGLNVCGPKNSYVEILTQGDALGKWDLLGR